MAQNTEKRVLVQHTKRLLSTLRRPEGYLTDIDDVIEQTRIILGVLEQQNAARFGRAA